MNVYSTLDELGIKDEIIVERTNCNKAQLQHHGSITSIL